MRLWLKPIRSLPVPPCRVPELRKTEGVSACSVGVLRRNAPCTAWLRRLRQRWSRCALPHVSGTPAHQCRVRMRARAEAPPIGYDRALVALAIACLKRQVLQGHCALRAVVVVGFDAALCARAGRAYMGSLPVPSMLPQARFCATRSRSSRMRTGIMSCRHAPAPPLGSRPEIRTSHPRPSPPLRLRRTHHRPACLAFGTGVAAERSPLRAEPLGP